MEGKSKAITPRRYVEGPVEKKKHSAEEGVALAGSVKTFLSGPEDEDAEVGW